MSETISWKRSILKSITWKIIGIIVLVLISYFLGVDLIVIGKITVVYHVSSLILYVLHERIWSKIKYGKKC